MWGVIVIVIVTRQSAVSTPPTSLYTYIAFAFAFAFALSQVKGGYYRIGLRGELSVYRAGVSPSYICFRNGRELRCG